MSIVKLQSSDGKTIEVDFDIITRCSGTIKIIMEDWNDAAVPLENINSDILTMVIEWAEFHFNTNASEEDGRRWRQTFVSKNHVALFSLIKAANYLDIKNLHDVTCKTVADMIRGKQTEEMRRILHIKDDTIRSDESMEAMQFQWL
ncbi:S-phase kinase-associated protein 1-like [Drosophila guanche]|uniref:Blast:S-phase kinase-associated protein 1 n=1 Tax=Drosophila guanche TaxID=7266 RepID=A0A3B0KVS8_DROGU|nr:S-phase kinase-associated protein 1-like [Drosophila guanche]SPP89481.1 blast:S-phase kinase-associated protein 1 [Drosophila guanche]